MYITMIASECAPIAKVGGLADVVGALSLELGKRGHTVEIILPKYDCLRYDRITDLEPIYNDLWVPWYGSHVHCTIWSGKAQGLNCLFIEAHSDDAFFNRGHVYGSWDDNLRFAFFSKAAMEFLYKSGKRPDIIHCHDWPTGLVPVLLYEIYQSIGMERQRVCYTIHNFAHQGRFDHEILKATGLNRPEYYYSPDRLADPGTSSMLNMMKGAIMYSNAVTTVSPTHAKEALETEQGWGMGETLRRYRNKFQGILNGIDYDTWNPASDRFIEQNYTPEDPRKKIANKKALRKRLLLRDDDKQPIIGFVGRLDKQKGVSLLIHSLFYALNHRAQFVLLGTSPDPSLQRDFENLKTQINNNPDSHLELSFNEGLSHQIYAAADFIMVPSLFEPCGLIQMIAMKYGTLPIVRSVGGLADTVFDVDHSAQPKARRNGISFDHLDNHAVEWALNRALTLWRKKPDEYWQLVTNAMKCDYSWQLPGDEYMKIYDWIKHP